MAPPSDADARRALLPILGSLAAVGVALAVSARDAPRQIALETPGPSDVLLASFPKSGNNWARFLVGHLLLLGPGGAGGLDFHSIEVVVLCLSRRDCVV